MDERILALIRLRDEAKKTKDLPKAKKRRLVTSAVMNSLVNVPEGIRAKLMEYWKEIPPYMTVEQLIICQRAYNAMTDGKRATEDAALLLDTAYGKASVDSEIQDTYALPELTKDLMNKFRKELDDQY